MPSTTKSIMDLYISELKKLYGVHLRQIILYGSYARGDFHDDSDIDIMILLDSSDEEIIDMGPRLSDITYDFRMDYDVDFQPIVKNEKFFNKWVENYPFYANVRREGVILYGAA